MKRIALDIETTGLDPEQGHKIVEIGCVELENNYPTGNVFQQYINPDKSMPEEALKIHGLTDDFLSDKKKFNEIKEEFLNFIKNKKLIIHNAEFDIAHLNNELGLIGKKKLENEIIDTLVLARNKFPGLQNSLDSLCKRYNIDNSKRNKHGALLDAELLADVFLEMNGGRQKGIELLFDRKKEKESHANTNSCLYSKKIVTPNKQELLDHKNILKKLKNTYW